MFLRRAQVPALIFLVCAGIYVLTLWERVRTPSPDNHFVHLANSWLHGQLHMLHDPPGTNDWACYDTEWKGTCPNGKFSFPGEPRYRWYVSFPPFPAVLLLPAVAIWDVRVPDRLFWGILAGLAPAFLYVLLRFLSERGLSARSARDNLLLTALFAFGSVYYFVAVQGSVWFAAQVVLSSLASLYLLWALDARRPILAGTLLGFAFMTRPTTALLGCVFAFEALRVHREADSETSSSAMRAMQWAQEIDWKRLAKSAALFGLPIMAIGAVAMWFNWARFDDPFEFGHRYLQVIWRPRLEKWGFFNYHYFARNLAMFTSSLPWLTSFPPYVKVSEHGLALWFTTPPLLLLLWPKRMTPSMAALYITSAAIAIFDLCYQNSGWEQFGYRFALDYMVVLITLLALGGRHFGKGFLVLLFFSIGVNTFGAITFGRNGEFYDNNPSIFFQPD